MRHVNEDERISEFAFALQFLEPSRMTYRGYTLEPSFWVENADIEWNERESPFHVVARLRLLPKSGTAAWRSRSVLDRCECTLHARHAADRQHQSGAGAR